VEHMPSTPEIRINGSENGSENGTDKEQVIVTVHSPVGSGS
jgi:hypothetical protein